MEQSLGALQSLTVWANDQPGWVRYIVQLVLLERRELSATETKAAYKHLLSEYSLSDEETKVIKEFEVSPKDSPTPERLILKSLTDVMGVNRLASQQKIEFNEGLTIIYGENAAGKSGYSRIIKSAAGWRTSKEVLGNVYSTENIDQSATIEYTLNSDVQTVEWRGLPIGDLHRVCVFYAPTAPLHVDENLNYHYTLANIELFEYVHTAIKLVQADLENDCANKQPQWDSILDKLNEGSKSHAAISELPQSKDGGGKLYRWLLLRAS